MLDELKRDYVNPGHASAYSGISKLSETTGVPRNAAVDALAEIYPYSIHREFHRPRFWNPVMVYKRRDQLQVNRKRERERESKYHHHHHFSCVTQIDLIDKRDLAAANDGYSYIVAAILTFSRKGFVRLTRTRRARETCAAIEEILDELGQESVRSIFCDRGTELKNATVRAMLERRGGIKMWHPNSEKKASVVERFNKSLQRLMHMHMTQNQTLRYVDAMPDLLRTYNNRPHSSLGGRSPNEADDPALENEISSTHRNRHAKLLDKNHKTRFKVGDTVRIHVDGGRFARSYNPQFSDELFTIVQVDFRQMIPMYRLRSQDDGEIVEGDFYAGELTLFRNVDGVYHVERVLGRRVRNGRREILVKWKGFGDAHNEWIPEDNVDRNFARERGDRN
jgi:hypothetical protein